MFFGRHLEVKLAKNRKELKQMDLQPTHPTAEDYIRVTREVVKAVTIGALVSFATVVAVNTTSEVILSRNQYALENKSED